LVQLLLKELCLQIGVRMRITSTLSTDNGVEA